MQKSDDPTKSNRDPRLHDWTDELRDFADTAALIDALDLVISVDTAVAHLAAALGKPVWLLNRFDTCWRWLLDRDDSPWYPTMRLFRQSKPGDWSTALENARDAILALPRNKRLAEVGVSAANVPGIEQNCAVAQQYFNRGNLAAAAVICHNILDAVPADAEALHLIGLIAIRIGMRDHAVRYLSSALSAYPTIRAARDSLDALRGDPLLANARPQRQSSDPKYLVIKSWGFGVWSDVSQVLGALLLAEVTDRIPVVHWGRNSLFGDGSAANAFHNCFEPVSNVTLEDVARLPGASAFPLHSLRYSRIGMPAIAYSVRHRNSWSATCSFTSCRDSSSNAAIHTPLPRWVMERRTRRNHFSSAALSITDDFLHRSGLARCARNRHRDQFDHIGNLINRITFRRT